MANSNDKSAIKGMRDKPSHLVDEVLRSLGDLSSSVIQSDDNSALFAVMGNPETTSHYEEALTSISEFQNLLGLLRQKTRKSAVPEPEIAALTSALVGAMERTANLQRARCQTNLSDEIARIQARLDDLVADACRLKKAIQQTLSQAEHRSEQKKATAQTRWQTNLSFITTLATDLVVIVNERATIESELRRHRSATGYSVLSQPAEMTELASKLSLTESTERSLNTRILEHYQTVGGSHHPNSRKKTDTLKLPDNLQGGDQGQEFEDELFKHITLNIVEYPLTYAVLRYSFDSFDAQAGVYLKPSIGMIPEALHQMWETEGKILYDRCMSALTRAVKNKVHSTFAYGHDPQESNKVHEGEGINLVYALLSLYKPITTAARANLRTTIYSSAAKFKQGNPRPLCKALRKLVRQADDELIELSWSMFGSLVVTILSNRSPTCAQMLHEYTPAGAKYKALASKDDSGILIDELFATIDAACNDIEAVSGAKSSDEAWQANALTLGDNAMSKSWSEKVTSGLGEPSQAKTDTKRKPSFKQNRLDSESTRCEALGCSGTVSSSWQVLCKTCFAAVLQLFLCTLLLKCSETARI